MDSDVATADVVSGTFASLLAKLIITGCSREDALERARRAVSEFEAAGLPVLLPLNGAIGKGPNFSATRATDLDVHTMMDGLRASPQEYGRALLLGMPRPGGEPCRTAKTRRVAGR